LSGDCTTLNECLSCSTVRSGEERIAASLSELHRKPDDRIFKPPMVILSNGFTKFAFSRHKVRFRDSLRSIGGRPEDEDILRFLTAVLASRMMQYIAFHSGSSNGIGRDKLHLYESLNLPFPLPGDELAGADAAEIVSNAATVHRQVEQSIEGMTGDRRSERILAAIGELEPLINSYYRINESEQILIEDTLSVFRPSIHRSNLDASIPALRFPDETERQRFADTLCQSLSRLARKKTIQFRAEGMASQELNLILVTVYFGGKCARYSEAGGAPELWEVLTKLQAAAEHRKGVFSYLRGFSYFDRDRLYILKPATLRNWCRTAALNDADTIFEYLNAGAK